MRLRQHIPAIAAGLLTCLCFLSSSLLAAVGENPPATASVETNPPPALNAMLEDALRQLKEQQASTFQAIELIRGHTESALQQNTITVSNQLAQLGAAIATHSERQLQLMRSTEGRTLRVILLILLVVTLAAGVLVLFVARALRGLQHAHATSALANGAPLEEPHLSQSQPETYLEHAVGSGYAAALAEVEKRIAALEHKPAALATPVKETSSAHASSASQAPVPLPRLKPAASVALAVGSGEALVFLPRDASPGAGTRAVSALGRIGRLFKRG